MYEFEGSQATAQAEAILSDEESALVYQEIVARRVRMTIDPDFSDYESRDVAEQRAKPFVALTTQYVHVAAELVDYATKMVVSDDMASVFDPQYDGALGYDIAVHTYNRLIANIWAPLPDSEESDFYWIETLCSAVLSNYLVGLIANVNMNTERWKGLWARLIGPHQEVSLSYALTKIIEPILGERAEELTNAFDPLFQDRLISSAISFARSRIDASALGRWIETHIQHLLLLPYQQYAAGLEKKAVLGATFDGDPVMFAIDDWITIKKALWGQAGGPPQSSESAPPSVQLNDHGTQTKSQTSSQASPHPPIRKVWFATNRAESKSGSPNPAARGTYFGTHSDTSMHFGRCDLSAANYHGATPPSSLNRSDLLITGRSRIDDEKMFYADISATLAQLPESDRQILIYIHGFNTSFDDAVINAGHIALGLHFPGVAICYSWPAPSGISVQHVPIASKTYHRASVRLRKTRFFLPHLLTAVDNMGATQVHLIAHSMGCDALMEALYNLSLNHAQLVNVGQVILAAPDVDIGTYKMLASSCTSQAKQATMYASNKDRALMFSRWVNHVPRAGLIPPLAIELGINSIDTSNANTNWTGHEYYMDAVVVREDMAHVIRTNDPPLNRKWLHGQLDMTGRVYWRLFYVNLRP